MTELVSRTSARRGCLCVADRGSFLSWRALAGFAPETRRTASRAFFHSCGVMEGEEPEDLPQCGDLTFGGRRLGEGGGGDEGLCPHVGSWGHLICFVVL